MTNRKTILILLVIIIVFVAIFAKKNVSNNNSSISNNIDNSNSKIVRLEFRACEIYLLLDNRNFVKVGNLESTGLKDKPCLQDAKYVISEDKKYVAFEDISGGVDSAIRIYSLEQDQITTLYVIGTSQIIDMKFLSDNILIVLSGYLDIIDRQYLTSYNVKGLYATYNDNILESPFSKGTKNFMVKEQFYKELQLPNLNETYYRINITGDNITVITHSIEKTKTFDIEEYGFSNNE